MDPRVRTGTTTTGIRPSGKTEEKKPVAEVSAAKPSAPKKIGDKYDKDIAAAPKTDLEGPKTDTEVPEVRGEPIAGETPAPERATSSGKPVFETVEAEPKQEPLWARTFSDTSRIPEQLMDPNYISMIGGLREGLEITQAHEDDGFIGVAAGRMEDLFHQIEAKNQRLGEIKEAFANAPAQSPEQMALFAEVKQIEGEINMLKEERGVLKDLLALIINMEYDTTKSIVSHLD